LGCGTISLREAEWRREEARRSADSQAASVSFTLGDISVLQAGRYHAVGGLSLRDSTQGPFENALRSRDTRSPLCDREITAKYGVVDRCNQFRIHVYVGRWKRGGVIVVLYSTDHDPRHVHVFEDGKRLLKFDLESWTVMEGKLTAKARKALESLRQEGVFDEKPKVQGD